MKNYCILAFFFPLEYPVIISRTSPSGPIVRGFLIHLLCEAIAGDHPITFAWTDPNGQNLSPDDMDGNITATINIYGNYTCTATNAVGMTRETIEIVEEGKP